MRRLARRDWPLVLTIDDAHWADQETLNWLSAFTENLTDLPVLVMVARRPGDISGVSTRHLDAVAAATEHPVTVLSALTPPAAAGLTRATLGENADAAFLPRGVGRHGRQPLRDRGTPRQGPGQRTRTRRGERR
ncbi:hypothetical protein SHIRM173S_12363 [Streptomyces hirsutus]